MNDVSHVARGLEITKKKRRSQVGAAHNTPVLFLAACFLAFAISVSIFFSRYICASCKGGIRCGGDVSRDHSGPCIVSQLRDMSLYTPHAALGSSRCLAAGRWQIAFDLQGQERHRQHAPQAGVGARLCQLCRKENSFTRTQTGTKILPCGLRVGSRWRSWMPARLLIVRWCTYTDK
jgi:hypothetical protein